MEVLFISILGKVIMLSISIREYASALYMGLIHFLMADQKISQRFVTLLNLTSAATYSCCLNWIQPKLAPKRLQSYLESILKETVESIKRNIWIPGSILFVCLFLCSHNRHATHWSAHDLVQEDPQCSNTCPGLLHFSIQWNRQYTGINQYHLVLTILTTLT